MSVAKSSVMSATRPPVAACDISVALLPVFREARNAVSESAVGGRSVETFAVDGVVGARVAVGSGW
jgi:hypothetical protein